jgi:hypothetical protein
VRIGRVASAPTVIPSFEAGRLSTAQFREAKEKFTRALGAALKNAGYPSNADPRRINYPMVLLPWYC